MDNQDQTVLDERVQEVKMYVANATPVILALDDTPFVLARIDDILNDKYDVRCCKTPLQAFGLLHKMHVDLLLLDVEMPAMSGIEFLKMAKEQAYMRDTKVLFLTAHAESDVVKQAIKLGASGYIIKPIEPDVLTAKVKEILG
jgi:PleD family two-component response regulator